MPSINKKEKHCAKSLNAILKVNVASIFCHFPQGNFFHIHNLKLAKKLPDVEVEKKTTLLGVIFYRAISDFFYFATQLQLCM